MASKDSLSGAGHLDHERSYASSSSPSLNHSNLTTAQTSAVSPMIESAQVTAQMQTPLAAMRTRGRASDASDAQENLNHDRASEVGMISHARSARSSLSSQRQLLEPQEYLNGDQSAIIESPERSPQHSEAEERSDAEDEEDYASQDLKSPARSDTPSYEDSPNYGRQTSNVHRYLDPTETGDLVTNSSPRNQDLHSTQISNPPTNIGPQDDNTHRTRENSHRHSRGDHAMNGLPSQPPYHMDRYLPHVQGQPLLDHQAVIDARADQHSLINPRSSSAPPLPLETDANGNIIPVTSAGHYSSTFTTQPQYSQQIISHEGINTLPPLFKSHQGTTFVPYTHPDQKFHTPGLYQSPVEPVNLPVVEESTVPQPRGRGRRGVSKNGMGKVVFFTGPTKHDMSSSEPRGRRHSAVTSASFVEGWNHSESPFAKDSETEAYGTRSTTSDRSKKASTVYEIREVKTRDSSPGDPRYLNTTSYSQDIGLNGIGSQSASSSQTRLAAISEQAAAGSEAVNPPPKKRGRPARKLDRPEIVRQNSGIQKKAPTGRRKKRSANPYIQVRYDRQAQLRSNYRELAKKIKIALETLAERDLDRLRDERGLFKKTPEYQRTLGDLRKLRDKYLATEERYEQIRIQHRLKTLEQDKDYINRRNYYALNDIREKHVLMAQNEYLDVFYGRSEPTDTKVLKRETPTIDDDSTPEPRHPHIVFDEHATKRQSLLTTAAPLIIPEGESLGEASLLSVDASVRISGDSGAATPESRGFKRQIQNVEEFDEYNAYVPKRVRRGRMAEPNNRVVVKAPFQFEDYEIGLRELNKEKMNVSVHLENFRYDQVAGNYNCTENTLDDLDQELVQRHKLHPRFGLPIPGCENPDLPSNFDLMAPLPRTRPVEFINKEGKKQACSRSVFWVHSRQDWAEHEAHGRKDRPDAESVEDAKRKMLKLRGVLDELWSSDVSPSPEQPSTPVDTHSSEFVAAEDDLAHEELEPNLKLNELVLVANQYLTEPEEPALPEVAKTIAAKPASEQPRDLERDLPRLDLYKGTTSTNETPNPLDFLAEISSADELPAPQQDYVQSQVPALNQPEYPYPQTQAGPPQGPHYLHRHSLSPVSNIEPRNSQDSGRRMSESVRPLFPAPPRATYPSLAPLPMLSQGGPIPPIRSQLAPNPVMHPPPAPPQRPTLSSPFPPQSARLPPASTYLQPLQQPTAMSPQNSSQYRELRPAPPQSSDPRSLFNSNTLPPPNRPYQSPPQPQPYNPYHPSNYR